MTAVKFIGFRGQAAPVVLPALVIALVACAYHGPGYGQDRSGSGPLALYDFRDESGNLIRDRSGIGEPLDLRIEKPGEVLRSPGQLEIRGAAGIRSDKPAKKIVDAVKRSGAVTIEAWVRPANTQQAGPARLVTISRDSVLRDITLGQEKSSFDVRLRTSKTSTNGLPSLATSAGTLKTDWTHVVYTRARDGKAVLFLNGRPTAKKTISGSLSGWDASYRLALGDEASGGRVWSGSFRRVAIYARALAQAEVKEHFDRGPQSVGPEPKKQEPAAAMAAGPTRVSAGLQLLYDFNEGDGNTVRDSSDSRPAIDLKIENMKSVRRSGQALTVTGETIIRSNDPPQRLIASVRRSGELTVEAWITPANKAQKGPARIVALSQNGSERNFTLGQEGNQYDVRFRTSKTDRNGIPSTTTTSGDSVKTTLTHVVYTRDRGGITRIYLNGRRSAQSKVEGTTGNWQDSFRIALANEFSGDRQWLGTYHLVAVYSRELTPAEVIQNFKAGPESETVMVLAAGNDSTRAHFFETKIAPLLSTHCLECHDSASRQGGLDLSRKTAALAGGESGVAIQPGKPDDSLVWQSVQDDVMPQDRDPLSGGEKALLRQWIESGAHWSVDWIDPAIYKEGKGGENWVRRLTLPEYIETVRTAVGVDIAQEARKILPPDTRADGFRNTAYNLSVDFEHVDAYAQLAEIIVQQMDVDRFASQFTKNKRLIDDDMRALVSEMGQWVLRGPLNGREVAVYRGITTSVASAGGDFEEAARYVLQAMLQSPRFLYRIENQRGDGSPSPASEYELASRISYIVWGAPPDRELIRAAEAGDLYDADALRKHVERMLQDPRAIERSRQFITQWLDLDRLGNLNPGSEQFPDWDPSIAEDMRAETLEFFTEVVWRQNRPLAELLNAQFTFATPRLAKHYRMDAQGKGMTRYDLTKVPERGGLLTQGSLLTIGGDNASMVTRGLFVLNDLLFSEVGDPPPGLDTTPVPPSPGRSHRAIAMERVESTSCGGCHSRFEPLAYGLERFDGLGSYHKVDRHGNQLREDGEILFPGTGKPVAYKSASELMDLLANSDRVSQCLTRKLTQFALGRPLVAADARSVRQIHGQAHENGGTYASTITAIVMSDLVQQTRTEDDGS